MTANMEFMFMMKTHKSVKRRSIKMEIKCEWCGETIDASDGWKTTCDNVVCNRCCKECEDENDHGFCCDRQEALRAQQGKMRDQEGRSVYETALQRMFSEFGKNYIHNDKNSIKRTTDFCLSLCKEIGCKKPEAFTGRNEIPEEKDDFLCYCVFEGCQVAQAYANFNAYCGLKYMCEKSRQ